MQISVLGPLEVIDGSALEVRRPMERALLTILAAQVGESVSTDRLVDGLWGEEPPASANQTLRTYVHHLRSILPENTIVTDGSGYRLASEPDAVDAHRFPLAVAAARRHLPDDPEIADRLLTRALELWRGTPFADAERAEWLRPTRTRLEALRLQATVDSLDARLRLGHHDEVVPDLRSLVEEHPLREDLWGLLMLALYRAGRQAEALRAFTAARYRLAEELGIDPGPDLRALEGRILAQDTSLLVDPAPAPEPVDIAGTAQPAPPPAEERRLVTFVVGELIGIDELQAHVGPETAALVVAEAAGAMAAALELLGGTTVASDHAAMIASFGIPVARDDDAYRAIRAGLTIRSEIADQSGDIERSWGGPGLQARVAVVSRPVTVPLVDADRLSAVGASLREVAAAADGGEVVVDDHTRRQLEDLFSWHPEPVPIGREERAWRVMATKGATDKARMAPRLRSPFVGRDAELVAAAAAVEALDRGLGGVLIVRGDAGVGKTRLLDELRSATGEATTWLIGHCASYAEAMPYWPFRDLLRSWLDLGVDDTELKARVALHARLEHAVATPERLYPYLAGMLGVTLEAPFAGRLEVSPEALQYRTFEVVGELFAALAGHIPLVVVIEDIHWADPTSVQLVERLLDLTDRTATLLVLTTRPDPDHPSYRLGELARRDFPHRLTELTLTTLAGPDQQAMLDAMIGTGTLPATTGRRLLDLAEGNPFYLEELVGSLVDDGALVAADGRWVFDHEVPLAVPETVEKVVQARIDRLDHDAHELVTSAAALGRSFGLPLLQGVLGDSSGVLDAIQRLLRLDLLVEARRWPHAEYLFKHVLIQEAAYRTLTEPRRADLHRRAAAWLEHRHADNVDEVAGLLANHWAASGDDDRAAEALLRAGDVARREHALDEAVDHYRTLLPILERRGDRGATVLVLLKLAHALHTSLRFAEANDVYRRAFDLWEYEASPPADAVLRFATPPLYRPVDPVRSYVLTDMQLQMALFDRLVERWPDDTLVPSLAERWEVSADGLRYRFTLRAGLAWSDGHPLTAADAAFGVLRNLDPDAPGISVAMLYVIEGARDHVLGITHDLTAVGVEAIDDRTVEFRLNAPAPYFLSMLNRPDCGPQPRHAIEAHGRAWHESDRAVVSGPFRRIVHTDTEIVLERRNDYQGMRFGNVGRVEWSQGPFSQALEEYVSGRRDLLWIGGAWEDRDLRRFPSDHVWHEPPAGLWYLLFDSANPTVADVRMRKALAHAIDREALASALGFDETVATGGIVPPPLAGHTPDIALSFDPELARALLAEAEAPGPLRAATVERFGPQVRAVVAMWREHLALDVELDLVDRSRILGLPLEGHEYGVLPSTWYPGYTDPEYFLRLLLASDAMDNFGRWNHPPYDDLIRRAAAERDERARLELFHAADRMAVAEQVAVIPLSYAWNTSVRAPHVHGWWEFGKSWSSFADLTVDQPG